MAETFTEKTIKAALAAHDGKRRVLWDDSISGLGLKLLESGSASWVYVYRMRNAKKGTPSSTLTLGRWPAVGLAAARAAGKVVAGRIALGENPAEELKETRRQERGVLTQALEDFEKGLERRKIVNIKTTMSSLRRGLQPYMAREVDTLSRAMVVGRIEELEAAGKPGAAQDLRKACRSFLEWCHTRDLVKQNVLLGLRRPRASRAEKLDDQSRKGRALADGEVMAVWTAASEMGSYGSLVRLALLTAMRRGELAALKWSDVLDDRIVIGAAKAKTGVRHEIPLTPMMRNVLQAQPKTTSPLVFTSPRRKAGVPLSGWSHLLARLNQSSGVDCTLHDFRRTARTTMSRCGISDEIGELAIGHVRQGLLAIYNHDTSWDRRIDAFESVSNHVARIIADGGELDGATVVAIRKRGTNL